MIKRGSLTSTILGLMLVFILLSSSLALYAILNLSISIGDAKAINASGSLRMQSYRLMLAAQNKPETTPEKIIFFEQTLHSEALQRSLNWYSPEQLSDQYLLVIERWQSMRKFIETKDLTSYRDSLKDFVDTIDTLVLKMEQFAALKLRWLVISQVSGLILMLLIAIFAVSYTRKKVVKPLKHLMNSAETISKGVFDVDMPKTEYIELTALSRALKKITTELSTLYRDLEGQVNEKTLALTRTNNELNFLYDSLVNLHADQLEYKTLKESLDQLKRFERISHLRIVIEHTDETSDVIEAQGGWPEDNNYKSVAFPLMIDQRQLGQLEVISDKRPNHQLFENFALMLTRSITIHNATEERQQLALMEERAVIARELHDSLGQLLSFLKIQVNLLTKSLKRHGMNEEVEKQINEINSGVSTAYSQLRELLSTFRLTIKEPDLKHGIEVMLEQLKSQTKAGIELDYKLPPHLMQAKQHIHILQITREATLNAIKHANASEIVIRCHVDDKGNPNISICDNGKGIEHIKERDQHFGIGIMHERANKLNGKVNFHSNMEGGTTVNLSFPPQQEPLNG
ncbi:nitrate/nitrite two-component system sensor histidine kinase NarQ [Shewanella maritima]|uniref:nitrate/nitrite two-component system sensor histidine kinase NarQ n=1 Tax=Shewanella maritima TaxID=2520507 RepID=UPI0013EE8579|nr:nitrate/nitrite two-component system sensor histidine kinase NarQ [Shewanella maritima]